MRRRAAAIGHELEALRTTGLAGTPAEIVDRLGVYADMGVSRVYLQVLDLDESRLVTRTRLRCRHEARPISAAIRSLQTSRFRSGERRQASGCPSGIETSGGSFLSHGSKR